MKMEETKRLREKANRCYRLARTVNSHQDFALLEAMGAEADQAAAYREAAAQTEQRRPHLSHGVLSIS
jgi:hypothetical protein